MTDHQWRAHIVPNQTRRDLDAAQVAVDGVMAEPLTVVSEVGQRVVDLANEQILAVVEPRNFVAHGRDFTAISRNWRLIM